MQKDFSYLRQVDDISTSQKLYKVNATPEQCRIIAEILQVPAVKDFSAHIYTKRQNKSPLIDVWGNAKALITRQSVISLENFDKLYQTDFALQFDVTLTENQVREMEEEGIENIPDVVMNNQIDLYQLALEQIALILEDYPRQEGENFTFTSEFDAETTAQANPFKILEKLKK